MSTPTSRTAPGPKYLLVALIAAFGLIFLAGAPKAAAAPVTLTFDNGKASLGSLLEDRTILPADSSFPSPDLPTPQRTDIQLIGDQTGGVITIPAALNTGLQFPYMHVMHPLEPGLKIPFTMRLNSGGLAGTWDEQSGAMTLEGAIDLVVVTGTGTNFPVPDDLTDLAVPPLGAFARCRFDDVPMSFSTANDVPYKGVAFSEGFGKKGAMTTSWPTLGTAVSENGGDCEQLNSLVRVPGGIWLSQGITEAEVEPEPEPTCETQLSLCPPPRFTEVDGVRLKPRNRTARPGQKIMLTVRVHNSGNMAAMRQPVKIRATSKRVKVPKRVFVNVPANGSATARFPVRVKRGVKRGAVVVASSNSWHDTARIKVKPRAKPKQRR